LRRRENIVTFRAHEIEKSVEHFSSYSKREREREKEAFRRRRRERSRSLKLLSLYAQLSIARGFEKKKKKYYLKKKKKKKKNWKKKNHQNGRFRIRFRGQPGADGFENANARTDVSTVGPAGTESAKELPTNGVQTLAEEFMHERRQVWVFTPV
jgi:hypothetical protein